MNIKSVILVLEKDSWKSKKALTVLPPLAMVSVEGQSALDHLLCLEKGPDQTLESPSRNA